MFGCLDLKMPRTHFNDTREYIYAGTYQIVLPLTLGKCLRLFSKMAFGCMEYSGFSFYVMILSKRGMTSNPKAHAKCWPSSPGQHYTAHILSLPKVSLL